MAQTGSIPAERSHIFLENTVKSSVPSFLIFKENCKGNQKGNQTYVRIEKYARKENSCTYATKDKSTTNRFIFFAQNIGFHFLVASHFESPLPLIFNSTFQFYFSWKFLFRFYSDFRFHIFQGETF